MNGPSTLSRRLIALLVLSGAGAGCDDGGLRMLVTPAAPGSGQVNLAQDSQGRAVLSWIETEVSGNLFTTDSHHSESPQSEEEVPTRLRTATLSSGTWSPAATVAGGTRWFVNWADIPSVVPVDESFWLAHWLVRAGDSPYAYDSYLSSSPDGGVHWGAPFKLNLDGTATEHGFVSLFPLDTGSGVGAGVVWLDGRETLQGGDMTVRFARVDARGLISNETVLDTRACDCCQTDVAVAAEGPVLVYRDRSEAEIRDISVSRWQTEGWTQPANVAVDGWRIEGCPVNGPAIAAQGSELAVAWYTAADSVSRVRLARSSDGGASFEPPATAGAGDPLGRVDVALDDRGRTYVSWLERNGEGGATLMVQRFGPGTQAPGTPYPTMTTALNRPAGFPRMLLLGDELLLAWTDVSIKPAQVRTALLPISLVN
ncbi:MAG: hypothetical protein R3E82_00695 [Pseudomonadales bacterium]